MPRFAGLKLLPSVLRIRVCFIRDPRAEAVVVAAELDGSHIFHADGLFRRAGDVILHTFDRLCLLTAFPIRRMLRHGRLRPNEKAW